MRKSTLSFLVMLLLASGTLSAVELLPSGHAAGNVSSNSFELHLFAPSTASPGQVISIGLWTIFENLTSSRPDLAFNNTSLVGNTTLTFAVKINLGITASPHIHTPKGGFIVLAPFKLWTHQGAWITSYTVPSDLGLYGVHVYANYTFVNPRGIPTYYISQAETTFSVQDSPATASGVSSLGTINYAILGLVAVAIVLDLLLLFWKRSPAKP